MRLFPRSILTALSVLVILFPFSGCGEQEAKGPAPSGGSSDDPVVAVVGGANIYRSDVEARSAASEKIYDSLTDMSQEEIMRKKLEAREMILEGIILDEVMMQKAAEMGITETPEMRSAAEAGWEETVVAMTEYVLASYPDLSGSELDEAVSSMLNSQGLNKENSIEGNIRVSIRNALLETVSEQLPAPEESDIQEAYDELLERQKTEFSQDPSAFESTVLRGEPTAFCPEPCRVVSLLNYNFDEDVIGLISQLLSVGDEETAQEMIADQFLLLDDIVGEVLKRLENGESFSELQQEGGSGTIAYNYLTENTTRFSDETRHAVWSLDKEGQWTTPIKTTYGYVIYLWENTIEAGEIPLEQLYDEIALSLADGRAADAQKEAKTLWREEAEVELFPENLMGD